MADALHLIIQRLPTSPDGRYDDEVTPPSEYVNPNAGHSALYALVKELDTDKRFGPIIDDPKLIVSIRFNFSLTIQYLTLKHFRLPAQPTIGCQEQRCHQRPLTRRTSSQMTIFLQYTHNTLSSSMRLCIS